MKYVIITATPLSDAKAKLKERDINLAKLNKDPENYGDSLKLSDLVFIMKLARDLYYNSEVQIISDKVYDSLEDILREKKPNHPLLKQVGAASKANKVSLPFYMPSLSKIKPGTGSVAKWASRFKGPFVVMDKMDGTSILYDKFNQSDIKLYSRGKGVKGQDVTFLKDSGLKVPNPKKKIAARAELEIKDNVFTTKYERKKNSKDGFVNARGLVNGLINSKKNVHESIRDTDMIAYELIRPAGLKMSIQLSTLKELGFKVPAYKIFKKINDEVLSEYYKERKSKSHYDIDGLVVVPDEPYKRTTKDNPSYAMAFKMDTDDAVTTATVDYVEWNVSKHGYLKPRVKIIPVKLRGVTVSYATCHNAKFVVENKIGPGAVIDLVRSGDVIPYIRKVIKPTKAQLPDLPKGSYSWNETKVDFVLNEASANETVQLKKITGFFSIIGVEGMKSGIVTKLIDDGLDTVPKILKAPIKRFMQVDGIQLRTATKLRQNIDTALANVTLGQLMAASGVFSRLMGQTRLTQICTKLPNVLELDDKTVLKKVLAIPGFQSKTATAFVEALPKFKKFQKTLGVNVEVKKEKKIKKVSSMLSGVSVCFTGFRDDILKSIIKQNGGKYSDGIGKDTTILVVKDLSKTSTKISKASQKGIKIMDQQQFKKYLKLKKIDL